MEQLQNIDDIANGDVKVFIDLFDNVKQTVMNTPEALYKGFWRSGGMLP